MARDIHGRDVFLTYKGGNRDRFEQKIKDLQAQARTLKAAGERINRRALQALSRDAQRELQRQIKARGREQATAGSRANLVEVAGNYAVNSTYTTHGFHFFDPAQLARTQVNAYYRAIEAGSRAQVGKWRNLAFLRGGRYVAPSESQRTDLVRQQRQATYRSGPRKGQAHAGKPSYLVQIERPIQPYRYISTAVERFQAKHTYRDIIESEVKTVSRSLARAMKRG